MVHGRIVTRATSAARDRPRTGELTLSPKDSPEHPPKSGRYCRRHANGQYIVRERPANVNVFKEGRRAVSRGWQEG